MEIKSDDDQVLKLINEAKSLALITDGQADADVVSAMLAFYHLFKTERRRVELIVPEAVPLECQNVPESSIIKNDFSPKNLIISLDTSGSPLSKISYWQEGEVFNLTIHPRERSFEIEKIRYSYDAERFDVLFVFSVLKIADLGDLYLKNQKEFSQTPIINFDFRPQNEKYGSINLIDESSSGLSEALFKKLSSWHIVPVRNSAQALLAGLMSRSSETGKISEKSGTSLTEAGRGQAFKRDEIIAKNNEVLIQ